MVPETAERSLNAVLERLAAKKGVIEDARECFCRVLGCEDKPGDHNPAGEGS